MNAAMYYAINRPNYPSDPDLWGFLIVLVILGVLFGALLLIVKYLDNRYD